LVEINKEIIAEIKKSKTGHFKEEDQMGLKRREWIKEKVISAIIS